ncbi:MAG: branched-chain amino acid ABC transporter permease [Betaproteobacteria bacterium]|nr:branched-chain amino acid ABC transporter permease [Betaproteobacteria bacterium]
MKKALALLVAFVLLPLALRALEQDFYISFASRVMIYALAATSLNFVLGYGGMISFGHAAFVGTGAYAAAILFAEGVASAWLAWPAAIVLAALAAALIGAVSLRTRGVYFIMITLAFAQMMFYLVNSLKMYGGDEGLTAVRRPEAWPLDLGDEVAFYYVALALLAVLLFALHRVSRARFGRALDAIRQNEARAEAIGFPVYRYRLACFVIAGAVAGLAGALLAAHGKYVNPGVLHWTQSGTLLIMVILGGVGSLWGGALGAAVLLSLEHFIADYPVPWLAALAPNYTQHAALAVGAVLLAVVLLAPRGIAGLLARPPRA